VNILIKNVPRDLLAAVNYSAARLGRTQGDWILEVLRKQFGTEELYGKGNGTGDREGIPAAESSGAQPGGDVGGDTGGKGRLLEQLRAICAADPKAIAETGVRTVVSEDASKGVKRECPDCGTELVENKVMKWWQCPECDWHGKKER
jgi:predicted RNA-binding Zn-ribbon protein involved in translation (DUF1610 family)